MLTCNLIMACVFMSDITELCFHRQLKVYVICQYYDSACIIWYITHIIC